MEHCKKLSVKIRKAKAQLELKLLRSIDSGNVSFKVNSGPRDGWRRSDS